MTEYAVLIDVQLDRRINYAMQQNDVPVVVALRVENAGADALVGARVEVTLGSQLAEPWSAELPTLAPGASVTVEPVDIALRAERLVAQTEREATGLEVLVRRGDEIVGRVSEAVEVLAYNEWGGLASLPEIAAAFVLPNHPSVDRVLARAAELLAERTGNGALSGYTSRERRRVRAMVGAIWTALVERGLEYTTPPASYESEGQKVRSPDQVLGTGLGTCLDLTLLMAACLEQAGLNALLIFCKDHALVGCWTSDTGFGEPAVDASLRLRKRVQLGDVVACETTLLTSESPVDVSTAMSRAESRLVDSDDVLCTIDVAEARSRRIRPLPLRVSSEAWRAASDATVAEPLESDVTTVVAAPAGDGRRAASGRASRDETGPVRLERWKRRLLDLSMRNRLLNHRESKRTIPLQCSDPAALEDALAMGAAFSILPRHELMEGDDPRDASVHEQRTGENPIESYLLDMIGLRRVHADLPAAELEKRLIEVYRASRLSLEETGANVLFLAVGFLTWYESESDEQPRRAPILLIPLQLWRTSVFEGFSIALADDDARINVTLLEKLHVEFGLDTTGLDALTEDEAGYDVGAILNAFRRVVADFDRWDVEDTATIGLFSFAKFLMWRDLEESADVLLRNDVARHLIERPGEAFPGGDVFPPALSLDADYPPAQVLCPLDADSSQLRAVLAAAEGRSFRLEGPPGTGKSQTIANLVSQALACGQRVLFVAAKQAALQVVQRRLASVGLSSFCLAVHSAKATKREVLTQLGEALDLARTHEPDEWKQRAERLGKLRAELNEHVLALHERGTLGRSVYDVVSRLIELADVPELPLHVADPLSLSDTVFAAVAELCDRADAALDGLGRPAEHGLCPVRLTQWTPALVGEARAACRRLSDATEALRPLASEVAEQLGLVPAVSDDANAAATDALDEEQASSADALSARELAGLTELVELVLACPGITEQLLTTSGWRGLRTRLELQIERAAEAQAVRAGLAERWNDRLFSHRAADLAGQLRRAQQSFVLVRFFKRRGVRRELASLSSGALAPDDSVLADLDAVQQLLESEADLARPESEAATVLGPAWAAGRGDPLALRSQLEWVGRVRGLLGQLAGDDPQRLKTMRTATVEWVVHAADLIAEGTPLAVRLAGLATAVDTVARRGDELGTLLNLDAVLAWGDDDDPGYLRRVTRRATTLHEHADALRPWCHWQGVRAELQRAELQPLIDALETGALSAAAAPSAHERALLELWLTARFTTDDRLRTFHGSEHARKIERFAELDAELLQLNRRVVAARLAVGLPSMAGEASDRSELGILQRELRKKRRHMSLRRLFATLPHLLPRLKPCLLMSPMAVAQHLSADIDPFDLVIFDEASQIPVWDAVGAIARGRHVIVVGDSRQLPPTTFFMKAADDGDEFDDESVEELESLLDECAAARLPSLDLLWHYRSRDERLIAFSNAHYYKGRLNTFPAACSNAEDRGVSLVHLPDGVYDRSRTRTNRLEAEAVVAEVCRRMKAGTSLPSLGVVAASLPQQQLIDQLIESARRKDIELDARLSQDVLEPLFVKNLENVQGDERDVILLTVGYGPDVDGKLSMNFGPLNREGGERRLNVAITRARCELVVFTSLRPEQIDLTRTRATGVAHLKAYLEYAAQGPSALDGAWAVARREQPSDVRDAMPGALEQDVAARLVEQGYQVEQRVGCSAYRVDLAVRDDRDPDRFLLGIEFDGPTYARASTARDRDRLRASVLRGLGWQLHRIWSTEWWLDRERELARLDAVLKTVSELRDAEPPAVPVDVAPNAEEDAPGRFAQHDAGPADEVSVTVSDAQIHQPVQEASGLEIYRPCDLGALRGEQQQFHSAAHAEKVAAALLQVVQDEGPVHVDAVARRVSAAWGIERLSSKVRGRVEVLAASCSEVVRRGDFLWPVAVDPATWLRFRVPADQDSERRPEELPTEELAAAAAHVLAINIGLPRADLQREMARLFGYQRTGRLLLAATERGVEHLQASGGCSITEETVTLP